MVYGWSYCTSNKSSIPEWSLEESRRILVTKLQSDFRDSNIYLR